MQHHEEDEAMQQLLGCWALCFRMSVYFKFATILNRTSCPTQDVRDGRLVALG